MANRVTYADVQAIMDNCSTAESTITVFITTAHTMLENIGLGLSEETLTEMEKWLAAHLIASTVFRTTSDEKVGDAALTYTGKWGMRLDSTPYGQILQTLDTTGVLANAGKMAASIYAVKEFDE